MTIREIVAEIVGYSNVKKFYTDLEIAIEKGREIDRKHEKWKNSKEFLEFKIECEERNKRVMEDFKRAISGEHLPISVR